jgi:putative transposase
MQKNGKSVEPTTGAYIESFHDKLRDECLNREIFSSLLEARLVLEQWRQRPAK